jgi:hypothetical protein
MPAWVTLYAPVIAKLAGADVPLAMLLGHVQHESGGNPNDRTKLDERGLFQIHPGTSKEMGYDHNQMFNPNYSIWAGIDMFKRMAARLQREYAALFSSRDDFFWHVVRFEFSIGSGAVRQILRAMQADRLQPRSWAQFRGYLQQNRQRLLHLTKHDPVKWAEMVDRVFITGAKLAHGGVVVASSGFLLIGLAALAAFFLYENKES